MTKENKKSFERVWIYHFDFRFQWKYFAKEPLAFLD